MVVLHIFQRQAALLDLIFREHLLLEVLHLLGKGFGLELLALALDLDGHGLVLLQPQGDDVDLVLLLAPLGLPVGAQVTVFVAFDELLLEVGFKRSARVGRVIGRNYLLQHLELVHLNQRPVAFEVAEPEAEEEVGEEFREIYNIQVIQIPTNKPVIRDDRPDILYTTLNSKFKAVVQDIKERYRKGQPVLVGTVAVETSELLSNLLTKERIPHEVLNAKNHFKEAEIVLNAGQKGAVTIATNMAGRGTDIKLGLGVAELGGLAVIGTERHESRRIDNQLRGRSGRQGDPGVSQFYLSLEDDLMKRFGSDRVKQLFDRMKLADEDTVIQSKMITRQVEAAQKRVEGNNYDTRKNVLQYDDVMREQREVIYGQRQQIIMAEDSLDEVLMNMVRRTIDRMVEAHTQVEQKDWNLEAIVDFAKNALVHEDTIQTADLAGKSQQEIKDYLYHRAQGVFDEKKAHINSPEQMLEFEKVVILRVVDANWTEHIDAMDQLRQSIGLRAYGQNNPLVAYQTEGFTMFEEMIGAIEFEVTRLFMKAEIRQNVQREQTQTPQQTNLTDDTNSAGRKPVRVEKVGRNDPCPCGSGKKYKNCHGKNVK